MNPIEMIDTSYSFWYSGIQCLKTNHSLVPAAGIHLTDVLEDSPDEHHLANLNELEAHGLVLQLPVSHLGVLVNQAELGILRPGKVEEVKTCGN